MRVKRYVVNTLPDALPLIRSELGKDAVILNTKEVYVGGFLGMFRKKKMEVIAAIEAGTQPPQPPKAAPRAAPHFSDNELSRQWQQALSNSAPGLSAYSAGAAPKADASMAVAAAAPFGDSGTT